MISLRKWFLIAAIVISSLKNVFAQWNDPITKFEGDYIKREKIEVDRDNRGSKTQRELNEQLDKHNEFLRVAFNKEAQIKLRGSQLIAPGLSNIKF